MKNVFEFLINTGVESLEMVADAEKKATICASLAQAIAQSGLLSPMISVGELTPIQESEAKEEKSTKKKASGKSNKAKEALKPEASKMQEPAPIVEEPVEVPQEPVETEAPFPAPVEEAAAAEPEMVDEWTDEMCNVKAEQLGLLQAYCEAWGEDYIYGDCLSAFSEGVFTGGENVRPSNIDGFVVYLQELANQFAQE